MILGRGVRPFPPVFYPAARRGRYRDILHRHQYVKVDGDFDGNEVFEKRGIQNPPARMRHSVNPRRWLERTRTNAWPPTLYQRPTMRIWREMLNFPEFKTGEQSARFLCTRRRRIISCVRIVSNSLAVAKPWPTRTRLRQRQFWTHDTLAA